jgi:hypothetical protein
MQEKSIKSAKCQAKAVLLPKEIVLFLQKILTKLSPEN